MHRARNPAFHYGGAGRPAAARSAGRSSRARPTQRPLTGTTPRHGECRFQRTCDATIRRAGDQYLAGHRDREDYAQEAWLAILTALAKGQFRPGQGSLEGWMFVVARNRAVSFARRHWRLHGRRADLPRELPASHAAADPRTAYDRQAAVSAVRQAVQLLQTQVSPVMFEVFRLRWAAELTVAEVAQRLGLTAAQVRVYDYRARRKLAAILSRRGFA